MTTPQARDVEQAKLNLRNSIMLVQLGEGNPDEVLICIDQLIAAVRAEAIQEKNDDQARSDQPSVTMQADPRGDDRGDL